MNRRYYMPDFPTSEEPVVSPDAISPPPGPSGDDLELEVTALIERPVDSGRPEEPAPHTTDLGFLFRLLK